MVDILDISEELKNFASNGVTLNIEERIQLEMALHELQSKINAEEIMFWGKINGLEKDYYIAVALQYSGQYEFPRKTFFYTLGDEKGWNFTEMPELNRQHDDLVN